MEIGEYFLGKKHGKLAHERNLFPNKNINHEP
jgi:hypothetical protein